MRRTAEPIDAAVQSVFPATLRVRGGGCGSSKVTPGKPGVGESGVVAVVGSSAPPPPEALAAPEPKAPPAELRDRTPLQLAAEKMVAEVTGSIAYRMRRATPVVRLAVRVKSHQLRQKLRR